MQLFNRTELTAAAVPSQASSERLELVIVAKGTFRLKPDGVAEPADEPLPLTGDAFEADDPTLPLRYPSDFAPFKPFADLLLVGTAHAPDGVDVRQLSVRLAVGADDRTLTVTGDRAWAGRFPGRRRPSDPVPFTSMPLSYARSFGGSSIRTNPVGLGGEDIEDERGARWRPLPNIEDPDFPLRGPTSRAEPAGFGPLPETWPQRADRAGRFKRDYRETCWPALPPDFDWSYFNAAPLEMQVDYLRGDESIEIENLHPEHPVYRSRLPGLRARCFVEDEGEDGEPRLREARMRLDTLWIDADAETLVLVWRARAGIRSKEADEVQTVWLATEPLVDEPEPARELVDRLREERDAAAAAPQPEAEPASEEEAAGDAAFAAELGKLRDQLAAGGVPSALLAKLDSGDDPDGFLQGLFAHFKLDPAEAERVRAEADARLAQMARHAGEDPDEVLGARDTGADGGAALRGLVESRYAAGESLAEEDLSGIDLSGAELPGIDLREAILSDANLDGANLEGADFSGATLSGVSLVGAVLRDAKLGHADLGGADLSGADLSGALLAWAVADGARLVEARLVGIDGAHWQAPGADLSRADLSSARLEAANLESTTLDETRFSAAQLVTASLRGAKGEGTDMRGADLTKLRASDGARFAEAKLAGVRAPGSMWASSDLTGSDFSGAELPGSDLSACTLRGTSFAAANLRRANLSKSDLDGAVCADANLFEGNLYAARIGRADFSQANLFGAETEDAVFDDAHMGAADTRRTKLAL